MNNKDIFDTPEINDQMQQVQDNAMKNLSDREKGFLKKNNIMLNYINSHYLTRLYAVNDESYVELNVSYDLI
jgi:hypothetical protein